MSSPIPVHIVTGAGGALGAAVVQRLLGDGAQIVAVDHAALPQPPSANVWCAAGVDLRDATAAATLVQQVLQRFGRIDGLVNVAGGFAWEKLEGAGANTWTRMFELNLLTTLNTCQAALPPMLAQGRGHIVNIGAGAAGRAGLGMGAYAASKAAVQRLTEALSEEVKDRGLHVHVILPSVLDTAANRRDMPEADFSRWVSPAALADVVGLLLSPAADGMFGAAVPVAGRVG